MKDKIIKEVMDWYEKQEDKDSVFVEDFVDEIIKKTANAVFDEIKGGLKEEFEKGNLKHQFIISDEYYLYLKLKEIKSKFVTTEEETNDPKKNSESFGP